MPAHVHMCTRRHPCQGSPTNQHRAQQGALDRTASQPSCVQPLSLRKAPSCPSGGRKVSCDFVTRCQEPPVGRAQAATTKGQPASSRESTQPSLAPVTPSPGGAAGADRLCSGSGGDLTSLHNSHLMAGSAGGCSWDPHRTVQGATAGTQAPGRCSCCRCLRKQWCPERRDPCGGTPR